MDFITEILEASGGEELLGIGLVLQLAKMGQISRTLGHFSEVNMHVQLHLKVELHGQVHRMPRRREHMQDLNSLIVTHEHAILRSACIFRHELHHEVHIEAGWGALDVEPEGLRYLNKKHVFTLRQIVELD